ncbi:hypothetical protein GCM10009851_06060 [Herbiconiux moechotypicola]|uniref:DUF2207 domain-containing protein n=2 Tax=Herbiconiux moechotypicola TaxID=637393 RepID=A0ABN3DA43_9MICO
MRAARHIAGSVAVGLVAALGAVGFVAGSAAPASAAPASAIEAAGAIVTTDVDDFRFSSFDAVYQLGIDSEGHSTLSTTETFVAQFPEADQNRGIRRAIPLDYQGHPTDLTLVSVTDAQGVPREYETETDDENLLVTIAGDDYVHGQQSYVLTYTQRDVTGYFADTDDDEFYWDTNGTLWRQPFDQHTTTVVVAPELVWALTGDTACFVGASGSTTACEITRTDEAEGDEGGGAVFRTAESGLEAGDNVTVGIAFAPHTFTERDMTYFSLGSSWVQAISVGLALVVAVLALLYRLSALRDAKGRPVVVAEYTPPPGADLLIASAVMKRTTRAAASSFVDFAVRHKVQIVEQNEGGGLFSKAPSFWLRLLTAQGLNPHERSLAEALFGQSLEPGAWRELAKKDTALSKSIYKVVQATKKRSISEGYFSTGVRAVGSLLLAAVFVLGVVGVIAGVASADAGVGSGLPILLLVVQVAMVPFVLAVAFRQPLTAKGAELRDYILGIKLYIEWAEEDRFKALQSPEGALRTGVDAPDWGQVVKLYEKLLPYAVLLDLESQWAKVLGTYYESLGGQPDWYGGSTTFNSALFAASMSSLSSASASAFSGSSTSSSSGFSGGGGSSGGGGGGGGGGGV